MGKYDPLHRYLSRKAADELEMTFTDLERVLGAMLSNGAARREWWANETSASTRHVQAHAWMAAGYYAFLVEGEERVRFRRR
jgi:hypothetical protein